MEGLTKEEEALANKRAGLESLALMFIMGEDFRHRGVPRKRTTALDVLNLSKQYFPNAPADMLMNMDTAVDVINAFKELRYIPESEAEKEAFFQEDPVPHCQQVAAYILTQRERKKMMSLPPAHGKKPDKGL